MVTYFYNPNIRTIYKIALFFFTFFSLEMYYIIAEGRGKSFVNAFHLSPNQRCIYIYIACNSFKIINKEKIPGDNEEAIFLLFRAESNDENLEPFHHEARFDLIPA